LEHEPFLVELNKLYGRRRGSGSVILTCKRSYLKKVPKDEARRAALEAGGGQVLLVRATDGKRKLSTSVEAEAAAKFTESLNTVMKANFDNLKRAKREKRDKRKGKRAEGEGEGEREREPGGERERGEGGEGAAGAHVKPRVQGAAVAKGKRRAGARRGRA